VSLSASSGLIPGPARNADHAELRTGFEGRVGPEDEAGRGRDRVERLPDETNARLRPRCEDLVRARKIELLNLWKDQKANFDPVLVGHGASP